MTQNRVTKMPVISLWNCTFFSVGIDKLLYCDILSCTFLHSSALTFVYSYLSRGSKYSDSVQILSPGAKLYFLLPTHLGSSCRSRIDLTLSIFCINKQYHSSYLFSINHTLHILLIFFKILKFPLVLKLLFKENSKNMQKEVILYNSDLTLCMLYKKFLEAKYLFLSTHCKALNIIKRIYQSS